MSRCATKKKHSPGSEGNQFKPKDKEKGQGFDAVKNDPYVIHNERGDNIASRFKRTAGKRLGSRRKRSAINRKGAEFVDRRRAQQHYGNPEREETNL